MALPNPVAYWDLVTRLEHFGVMEADGTANGVMVLIKLRNDGVGPYYTMLRMDDNEIVHRRVVDAILRRFEIDRDDWKRADMLGPR